MQKTFREWLDEQKDEPPTRDETIEELADIAGWLYRHAMYQQARAVRHAASLLEREPW